MAVVAGVVFFTVRALLALTTGFPIKKWAAAAALAAALFYLLLSGAEVATQRSFFLTAITSLLACSLSVLIPSMPRYAPYYDPETDKSPFLDALWRVRHLCTRASATVPHMKAPGSFAKIEAIRNAIDDFAECETGHRQFFWNRPHKAG